MSIPYPQALILCLTRRYVTPYQMTFPVILRVYSSGGKVRQQLNQKALTADDAFSLLEGEVLKLLSYKISSK